MEPLLEAKALKKDFRVFKRIWFEWRNVVKDVSLRVCKGEIVCLLGPNGAGKSTSLKMICGVLKPDAGSVFLNGLDVTHWPMYKRCHAGLGYLAQENSLFRNLSVENNLLGVMQLLGYSRSECRDRCEQLIKMFDLENLRNTKASGLSGGERRRLEVARALTKDPKLIILDEPFAGVDPKVIEKVQNLIRSLRKELGIAILITDHSVGPVLDISDRGYVVASGEVIFEGGVQDLIVHPKVRSEYLGNQAVSLTYPASAAVGALDYPASTAVPTLPSTVSQASAQRTAPTVCAVESPFAGLDLSDAAENGSEATFPDEPEADFPSSLLSEFRNQTSGEQPGSATRRVQPARVRPQQKSTPDPVSQDDPLTEKPTSDSRSIPIKPFRRKPL